MTIASRGHVFLCVLLTISLLATRVNAKILWKNCVGIADSPQTAKGFFYELCVQKHKFTRRRHPWQFIGTSISDTVFDACTFVNTNTHSINFTEATFNQVTFKNSVFGSYVTTPKPVLMERVSFTHTTFDKCTFDKSAVLLFSKFSMINVTFNECIFEHDTIFELGNLQQVHFKKSVFQRSAAARVRSDDKILNFRKVTMRDIAFTDSELLHPIVMQFVNAADMHFNDTIFSEFWCHSKPGRPEKLQTSAFNDTIFQRSTFRNKVHCDKTTWRSMSMFNATFHADADFSDSNFQDIFWDKIEMKGTFDGSCTTLDLSGTRLFRQQLANMTMQCEIDLRGSDIEIVRFKNVKARRYILEKATFKQERIDGRCCTAVCPAWKCQCNYSRNTINDPCPKASYPTDLRARQSCFPARSTVQNNLGNSVRMLDVKHGTSVSVGQGEHSEVYFFGHKNSDVTARYVRISHSGDNSPLHISQGHYLYVNGKLSTAASVRTGDLLSDADGYHLIVQKVDTVVERGVFAPTSLHGDLIVDGVHVSSYTDTIHPTLAHYLLAPIRIAYQAGLKKSVEKFSLLHDQSYHSVARFLRLPQGPQVVGA